MILRFGVFLRRRTKIGANDWIAGTIDVLAKLLLLDVDEALLFFYCMMTTLWWKRRRSQWNQSAIVVKCRVSVVPVFGKYGSVNKRKENSIIVGVNDDVCLSSDSILNSGDLGIVSIQRSP